MNKPRKKIAVGSKNPVKVEADFPGSTDSEVLADSSFQGNDDEVG